MEQLTDYDLTLLIKEKLTDCKGYENVCQLLETKEGEKRLVQRVKEMIYKDAITNIEAALAQIETDLRFSEDT